ncbi:2'-5'-RNA ligase [Pirellulimonas nuda]|uniref:RNA 2',3'-cyclic phosphodiesterase n=1 Tax=Pirellulimonas nuda TaxID=2528009 RepID=A0A518D8D6_9BACT|nr:RNA 2',3'-cyclic phosphodiesterase [Pirellulimonas nuda]QDU87746.1 2'-5'-RNA ligase [Pirellulimonas nuda]
MPRTRTFIALTVNDAVRAAAVGAINRLRGLSDAVRWVEPENLHFTLHFLGEITDADLVDVCNVAAEAARQAPPFSVRVRGAGAFPDLDRPRALWLGVAEGAQELTALHDSLRPRLAELGFRTDQRRYRPHLTIGRIDRIASKQAGDLVDGIAALDSFDAGATPADALTVYASRLRREGPGYRVMATCPLGG